MAGTENLLQKLEEKTLALITEVEELRKENQQLRFENTSLKNEKEKQTIERNNQETKVKELIALVDAISNLELPTAGANHNLTAVKPMLVQG